MKACHHQFTFILALSLLSAVTACQSCLIDLARRGILKVGSTRSTNTRKPQQQHHAVSHSSVLPIGISSRELVRPIIPYFNAAGVDQSGLGYLLVRKLVDVHNNQGIHATNAIATAPLEVERQRTSLSQVHNKLKRILHAESNDEKDETKSDQQNTVDEKQEVEVMSQSMIMAIGFYKQFISPLLPPACRFLPTCSQYGVQAIEQFGPTRGVILTAWRLARCSPLGGKGYDPPKWPPVAYNYGSY
eukprot:scaffold47168_cov25-Cyclotella_meneghiniana.AAC.2